MNPNLKTRILANKKALALIILSASMLILAAIFQLATKSSEPSDSSVTLEGPNFSINLPEGFELKQRPKQSYYNIVYSGQSKSLKGVSIKVSRFIIKGDLSQLEELRSGYKTEKTYSLTESKDGLVGFYAESEKARISYFKKADTIWRVEVNSTEPIKNYPSLITELYKSFTAYPKPNLADAYKEAGYE